MKSRSLTRFVAIWAWFSISFATTSVFFVNCSRLETVAVSSLSSGQIELESRVAGNNYRSELSKSGLLKNTGRDAGEAWTVAPGIDQPGFLVFGPYTKDWNNKSVKASFSLETSTRNISDVVAFELDIYDSTSGEVIVSRQFKAGDVEPRQRLFYSISADVTGREGHSFESRLRWMGKVDLNFYGIQYDISEIQLGLPKIINASGVDDQRVQSLVRAAIGGLGFNGSLQGPNANDLFWVGPYYMAWIDQTGFVGKMNGLWTLNGNKSDLNFTLWDGGRPVNTFGVGDRGDGRFMDGYRGAEHYEIPDNIPEPWQQADCDASGKVCNWYSLPEQPGVRLGSVPWWSGCNKANDAWGKINVPIINNISNEGLEIVYESPIKKLGDGSSKGLRCGGDYRFPDGQVRPVYLQVGYRLYKDRPLFERIYRFRNPEGNPAFGHKVWSVINGLVMGDAVNAPAYKKFQNFFKMEKSETQGNGNVIGTNWTPYQFHNVKTDDVFAWLGQGYSVGTRNNSSGHSIRILPNGPSDNEDIGWCICRVHGGFELGGGLLHANISLPIDGGRATIWASRSYEFSVPTGLRAKTYLAGRDLLHRIGFSKGEGWGVIADGKPGHALFGPYESRYEEGEYTVQFEIMTDNNSTSNVDIFALDVFDSTTQERLAYRVLKRQELATPGLFGLYGLNFDLNGRSGHAIEFRMYVFGHSALHINRVLVGPRLQNIDVIPRQAFARTYSALDPAFNHAIGSSGKDGWEVFAGPAGALMFGPYVKDLPVRKLKAVFTLLADNNTAENFEILELDVNDFTADQVLVRKTLRRQELPIPYKWGSYELEFDLTNREGHAIEFRVWTKGHSYLKIHSVQIKD